MAGKLRMRLHVTDRVDRKNWDAMVVRFGGTLFHSSVWANYMSGVSSSALPRFFTLLSDSGEACGAALGFHQASSMRVLSLLTRQLRFDAIPVVVGDRERLHAFLEEIQAYARSHAYVELVFGSFSSAPCAVELEALGFEITRRLEFELALDRSEEDLWNTIEYKRRKNIKKAQRLNVVIEELPAETGVPELRRLQVHSSQRIVARGGPDISRKTSGADPLMVLAREGVARFVVAQKEGAILSASMFTEFNGVVYHLLSGHSNQALECQAPTLLLWETINEYRRRGAKKFNFGGCSSTAVEESSSEHGVYLYKKAYGGESIECASGARTLRPAMAAAATSLKRLWSRMGSA